MALSALMNVRLPMLLVSALVLLALAVASGCDEQVKDAKFETLKVSDHTYKLEVVADEQSRVKGLSGRTSVPEGTGMLFVFPESKVQVLEFVMRDCVIPIDIIFLDRSGRITAMHEMLVEEARKPTEPKPARVGAFDPYEDRLKRYSSRYAAQFVVELAGGELKKLKLSEGQKLDLDLDGLKKRAK
jgi:uncharacterized membrane protein (UPF0127 family)